MSDRPGRHRLGEGDRRLLQRHGRLPRRHPRPPLAGSGAGGLEAAARDARPGQDLAPREVDEISGAKVPPELKGRIWVSGDPDRRNPFDKFRRGLSDGWVPTSSMEHGRTRMQLARPRDRAGINEDPRGVDDIARRLAGMRWRRRVSLRAPHERGSLNSGEAP